MLAFLRPFIEPILRYIDKPWKVLALIAMVACGIFFTTVYEERGLLVSTIIHWYVTPTLKLNQFKMEAPALLAATNADATQLLTVSLETNLIQPVAGYYRGGAPWSPNLMPRPFVHDASNPTVFIRLINGDVVCDDLTADSPLFRVEYATGLRRVCLIGVPPVLGALAGIIYIGWNQPLGSVEEYGAKLTLHTVAMHLANW